MKKVFWLLILIGTELLGQPFNELKVGDKFPDYALKNVLNYPGETLKLSDFRGKLVILDLWGTTCTACVRAWPKLLELQKEFAGKIQIIPVDKYETKEFVREYVEKRRKLTGVNMTLPMACRDTTLWRLFPQNGVPRYYWIDGEGVVKSITNGMTVNSKYISEWLEKGSVKLPQMIESNSPYMNEPLFVDGNGGEGNADRFVWSSVLTKGVKTMPFTIQIFTGKEGYYGFRTGGTDIRNLYLIAYNDGLLDSTYIPNGMLENRIKVIAKDTARFYHYNDDTIDFNRLYNYQLICGKKVSRSQIIAMMREDLKRYFDLEVSWEKVKKKCLVWTIDQPEKVTTYKGRNSVAYVNDTEAWFHDVTVSQAIRFMEVGTNYMLSPFPIVDETNYKGLLNLRFNCNCLDWKSLAESFRKHGMNLKLEDREIDVLTLRER